MKRTHSKRRFLSERFPGRRIIPAGEFKPACLSLMDQVQETGVEIVITKHNEPVAKLVPVSGELRPFVGRSRGVIRISDEDLLAPVGEDWEVDADL
ncbi:MAG TPA: type II toxin-antitoxin system Phd/YefM family antitoxin [Longimicrobium sp.]|jgi:prevent-host-death family protein|uniref:type II toxin-antitoxin system Phd/YefM family antitoxin n=1 Tax=Longimicrobium sp. TaxID=2029185 RepID=UPI002ED90E5D